MTFLENVIIPNVQVKPSLPKKEGGFLSSIKLPTARDIEIQSLRREAEQAEAEVQRVSGFGGILKETGRDLFGRVVEAGKTFGKSLIQIYSETPRKLKEDVIAGAEDIRKGKVAKGIIKAGFRTAGDVANAIFAPLSAGIGAALQLTGAQNLIDKTGQKVADKSGITDWPAFQKFAVEHPNAGEDFERLLLLILSSREKGKIEPRRFANEIKKFSDKITGKPPPSRALVSVEPPLQVPPQKRFFQKIEIPSGEVIELSAPQQRLLLPAGRKPIVEPTRVPIYRRKRITKSTEVHTGDIISITDVGNWIVSGIKTRRTTRGKERIVVLKDMEGNIFEESVFDLVGELQISKIGERPAPIAKAPPKLKEPRVPIIAKRVPKIKEKMPMRMESRISPFKREAERIVEREPISPVIEGKKPSKVATSIEQRAIEKKLTEGFEGRAGFDPITIKEQARLVSEIIAKDIERAKRMVRGEEPVPEDIRGASLITGLEEYALLKGDVQLLSDLAKSPLTAETSRFAQELRVLAERSPESPVAILKDVAEAKKTTIEKRTGKKFEKTKEETMNEIKSEIKKNASQRPTWENFTKELTCNF